MIIIKRKVELHRTTHGQRRISIHAADVPAPVEPGRVPRVSRLMALAIRFDRQLRTGEVSDVVELARLGHITQPPVTKILNLSLLAPDIQESLLFLPRVTAGKAPMHEKLLRPVSAETDWAKQ